MNSTWQTMVKPNETKHLLESIRLSFEPTMVEILDAYHEFRIKYNARDEEIHLEDISERCVNECSDRHGCFSCERGYNGATAIVFSRTVHNENYELEMAAWRSERERLFLEEANWKDQATIRSRIALEGYQARKAWKDLQRQERISRRHMGRNTMR